MVFLHLQQLLVCNICKDSSSLLGDVLSFFTYLCLIYFYNYNLINLVFKYHLVDYQFQPFPLVLNFVHLHLNLLLYHFLQIINYSLIYSDCYWCVVWLLWYLLWWDLLLYLLFTCCGTCCCTCCTGIVGGTYLCVCVLWELVGGTCSISLGSGFLLFHFSTSFCNLSSNFLYIIHT